MWDLRHLDGFIGVGDEGDEERQHHVDEQWDERVEVSPTEEPHQSVLVLQLGKGGEHVVAVQEREQTLGHTAQLLELERRRRNKLSLLRISSAVDQIIYQYFLWLHNFNHNKTGNTKLKCV